jgi:hypothetical protein
MTLPSSSGFRLRPPSPHAAGVILLAIEAQFEWRTHKSFEADPFSWSRHRVGAVARKHAFARTPAHDEAADFSPPRLP